MLADFQNSLTVRFHKKLFYTYIINIFHLISCERFTRNLKITITAEFNGVLMWDLIICIKCLRKNETKKEDPNVCSHLETKMQKRFWYGLISRMSISGNCIRRWIKLQSFRFSHFTQNHPRRGVNRHFQHNAQNIKTCMLSKLLHRFQPNFAQWVTKTTMQILFMGVPNSRITSPRWRTAAILNNRKTALSLSRQRLDQFHDIWHGDAYWPSSPYGKLKFQNFNNTRWRPSSKVEK